ncbi:MAG: tRNA (adenosine(37)-N6)-dimethylallyltransferase MiaA [Phaeodactylibacter sp.]|nr:tRNA (adenosine(37)-N6)-dimethylallyltransferase MiaA [Phaeodactylibacter sp.]MCB9265426.1 tRNA (adenosine(37)-N6)-dimethylallyltransferase MiaA [Lewinellaceae bacterium]MCB9289807.1 tRNA (adenosine(37)-N6)-dimethylallyltransferase MiaA [Lewinellaceae bacterium]
MEQSKHKKHLLVVGGPTASGKTAFAIRLAQHFNTAIVSADSRQFYREMNIGTAKPTEEELAQAPHYLINSLSIEEEYSVGDFERDALQLLGRLFQKHDIVILAGGSGLYIKALCEGLDEFPEVPAAIRQSVEQDYREKGLAFLQEELARTDPDYYEEVDRQNPHRLIRALAVFRASGQPFSSFRKAIIQPRPFTPIYLQLHWPRQELYRRINRRVEQMMAAGLAEEARTLFPRRRLTALQTVGYQELFDHFDGKHSMEEAITLIKRNTRRYAKRQLTWYRRDGHWKLLRPDDWSLALEYIDAVRTEGLRLRQVKTETGPPFLSAEDTTTIQVFRNEEEASLLLYTEKKREALLQGPFLQPAAGEWTGKLLIHQAALLAGERQLFVFSPIDTQLFQRVCIMEDLGPEALPGWMEPHWLHVRKHNAEAKAIKLDLLPVP